MRAVNLLPADAQFQKKWWAADAVPASPRRILAGGGIVAAVLALSLLGAYILQRSIVNDRRETLAELTQEVTTAEVRAAAIRTQQDELQAQLAAFTTVTSARIRWEKVVDELALVVPDNAFLESLNVASPTASSSSAGAAATFTVTGTTSSQPAVALVLERLALLPWLSGVTLQSSTRGGAVVNFTIGATVVSTGVTG